MNDRRNTIIATASALLVVMLVAIGTLAALRRGPWAPPAAAAPPEDRGPVIAEVNGNPIYLSDARSRIQGISAVHGKIGDTLGDNWPDVVLQSLVDDQLLGQAAGDLGIEVTQEDMQTWYEQIRGSIGSGQTIDGWLQTQGMTRSQMDRTIVRQIIGSLRLRHSAT